MRPTTIQQLTLTEIYFDIHLLYFYLFLNKTLGDRLLSNMFFVNVHKTICFVLKPALFVSFD